MTAPAAGVSCIVLAAGSSRRFGSDKRQARLADGRTLLEATLESIPAMFAQRLLVLRPGDTALPVPEGWQMIPATEADQGMGHSLATGLLACRPCAGVVVVLADMPHVAAATYAAIVAQLRRDCIVVPRHHGQRGNPVGIGADFLPGLLQPKGDQGARQLLASHAEYVIWLDSADAGVLQDIDTREDLEPGAGGRN